MNAPQNDEIDLVQLTVNVTRFFRKNILVVLLMIFLGIVTSVSIGLTKSNVIQSKMILFSDLLTKAYCEQLGKNLNSLVHENNGEMVRVLNISKEEASQIHSIDLDFVAERQKNPEFENSTILVTAEFSNRQILPKLQDGIINYFRNNQFVKVRVEHRKEFYQKMIVKIEKEIGSMDSVKRLFLSGRNTSGKPELAFVDPSEINKNIVELYEDQLKYKNALDVVDSVQLVEGFTSIEKPPRLKTSLLILFGFLGGLFAALLFIGGSWLLKNSSVSKT
jgi:hypothetical protein